MRVARHNISAQIGSILYIPDFHLVNTSCHLIPQVMFISIFTLVSQAMVGTGNLLLKHHEADYPNTCPLYCGVITALSTFLNILNATVNFFVYCFFGGKFRKCFVKNYRSFYSKNTTQRSHLPSGAPTGVRSKSSYSDIRQGVINYIPHSDNGVISTNNYIPHSDKDQGVSSSSLGSHSPVSFYPSTAPDKVNTESCPSVAYILPITSTSRL